MADSLTQTFNELSQLMYYKNQWDNVVRSSMSDETVFTFRKAMQKRPKETEYSWSDQENYQKVAKYGPEILGYDFAIAVYRKNLEEADRDIKDIVEIMTRSYVRRLMPSAHNAAHLRTLAEKHNLPALRGVL